MSTKPGGIQVAVEIRERQRADAIAGVVGTVHATGGDRGAVAGWKGSRARYKAGTCLA